jgi:hypothetical protein
MKNRLVRAVFVLAGALAPWLAGAEPLAARLVTERPSVLLLKAPGEPLRFRWAARVDATGQFVLTGPDGSEVWTTAVLGRQAYEVTPPARSGEYELRYRDPSGRQHVLVHVLVACASVEHQAPMTVTGRPLPPGADVPPPHVGSGATAAGPVIDRATTAVSVPLGPPPTPPPRSSA